MLNTTLKIIKGIRNSILVLILFAQSVFAKEITNITWVKSVYVGKKLSKFRETVTSPALGKEAWKITLLPKDCGRDEEGDYSDCKNNGRDAVVGFGGGDRARSEYKSKSNFSGETWHSLSLYIPNDFKSTEPAVTSFFQLFERGQGPRMKLEVRKGVLDPRYYPYNGRDWGGEVHKPLKIDDMRGKWTTIIFHVKTSKDPLKGFMKMYVDDVLYNTYEGSTSLGKGTHYSKFGIYDSWISRWNEKIKGEYPTQVIYYDNLFRTKKKEQLFKLIQKN
jgi:hypothetical protein